MKNIDCSVVIGISREAAHRTDEGRLVFAASTVHGTAARTRLRGKTGIDLHELMRLVKQHRLDLVPAHVENSVVESALLSDVLAGVLHCPGRGFRHVFGSQALDNDRAELPANVRCRDVRPMLADAGLLGADRSNATLRLRMPTRTPLASAGNSLSLARLPVQDGKHFWHRVTGAIGEHDRDSNASINTDRAIFRKVLNVAVFAPDANLPTKRCEPDRGFSDLAGQITRHAEAHPSDLRQPHAAPTSVQPLNRYLTSVEGEGIVHAFLLWLRIAAKALKEAAVRIIQRLEHILLTRLADGADEVHLAA